MEKLRLGVAYHGNRFLRHVEYDMQQIVKKNMNLVVHMYTHNDMDRNPRNMKEIFDISKEKGLEVWVDNWGLAGTPGDKCHFLGYHPECRRLRSDGEYNPVGICYNHDAFVEFSKKWIDCVKEAGGETLFWDEPHLRDHEGIFECCCPVCKELFKEKFGYDMPTEFGEDIKAFQSWTISNYFRKVTEYSHSLGLRNVTCLMPISLKLVGDVLDLPYVEDIGTDPYWYDRKDVYEYVYNFSKDFMDQVYAKGKQSHIWLQSWLNKSGTEEEIYLAADAAYDAGARTIIAWSYRGGEPCDYRSDHCDMVWEITGDAMRRLRDRYQDEKRQEMRKMMGII